MVSILNLQGSEKFTTGGNMASDINIVSLTGNITRDPEVRATHSGTQVLSFSIACNASRKNAQTGQWEEYPNYVECTMFGARAEALGRILAKGMKVAVSGELRYSSWEKDGQKRSRLEVVANSVVLMQRKADGHQHQQRQDESPESWEMDLPF